MSISGALSNALSGLTVSSRSAEMVSNNIANALNENYARREVVLGARSLGGTGQGVSVTGVQRTVDLVLMSDRRVAQAGTGDRQTRAQFFAKLEIAIGVPGTEGSLTARVAAFETALIEAASRPESEGRLSKVADTARALAKQIGEAATSVQTARANADHKIGSEVDQVNAAMARVAEMNVEIRGHLSAGRDPSALMDQRQQLVDQIAAVVPLREVQRDNGQIALFTTGGAVLVDGRASVLGFTSVGVVEPEMTVGSGGLSGLMLNGLPIATSGPYSTIAGGTLAAHFAVRDELAPAAQAKLDAVARDLVDRFGALDPTLAPGTPGLFTDAGAVFLPADETGLAQRLSMNAAADLRQGGALWRLRDGLGAVVPGPTGNSSLLTALQTALSAARQPVSGDFMPGLRSFVGLNADMLSAVSTARLTAETEASFSAARSEGLRVQELQGGVDTDREMQDLLQIEKAFAANAKVIQTVDEMLDLLLGM
jgi:flagellar hook-associated protein 1